MLNKESTRSVKETFQKSTGEEKSSYSGLEEKSAPCFPYGHDSSVRGGGAKKTDF